MSNHLEVLDSLSIGQLRHAAKALNITADRNWTKIDFVKAIKDKQAETPAAIAFDTSSQPEPGFARILIHRDPTPGHKNTPVHVGLNGHLYQVPRGIEVDVPKEFIGVLKDARTVQVRQEQEPSRNNPGGIYRDEEQTSYPFQVLAVTPGQWKNPHDTRAQSYAIRVAFRDEHGSWPTEGELRDYKKVRMQRAV